MSEEFQQGVNVEEVAAPQEQDVTTQEQQGANESELANQKPVQDADTNAYYAEQRRKQELEQYRNQATEYQQNLDKIAKLSGYNSHDELLQAVAEAERQQERQQYEQAGIDPDMFNQLLEKHPDIQYARELKQKQQEEQQFQEQVNELYAEFPNLKPEEIQPEVWQLQANKGLSLLDAYLRVNYKNMGQQAEQQAIQKLTTNQQTSTGALGQEGTEHKSSYSQLSAKEKADLRARVLRGENVQL